jgi:hypothetical protein
MTTSLISAANCRRSALSAPRGWEVAAMAYVSPSERVVCSRGHLLEAPNLVKSKLARGCRECLACRRTHNRARRAADAGKLFDFQAVADEIYREIMNPVEEVTNDDHR